MKKLIIFILLCLSTAACKDTVPGEQTAPTYNPEMEYKEYIPSESDIVISREEYRNKLYGFWLGQCIANWTGLVTEMDKVGNIGEIKTGSFYTRDDWGKPDQPSIWSDEPSDLSPTIDFVFKDEGETWGADDDTDIEYMYQHLLLENNTSVLSPEQIRDGWLKHIRAEEENYLWVSNQKAFDLMLEGILPPETGDPARNPEYEMIDAQLTTEVFGLFAPARPDIALRLAYLPVRTTAAREAAWISEFYITMHSLASKVDGTLALREQIFRIADEARKSLPDGSYPAAMYDYVKRKYESGIPWEQTRDSVYVRYQVKGEDGYDITSRNLVCNGCFAAGINFAASLVSLFYGEGDIRETIKIGTLAGWDSDNPTATWGGLLGFMIGRDGIENAFDRKFAGRYNIHRTRQNFPDKGIDTFDKMAREGLYVIDRVVQEEMGGGIDLKKNAWYIPSAGSQLQQEASMRPLLLCIGLCAIIWIFNGYSIVHAIKKKILAELYMHAGMGIFFSVMVLELTIGNAGAWERLDSLWLQVCGFALYLPSGYLVINSVIALRHRGKARGTDFTESTRLIKEGLYGRIRQPMSLGLAIWSVAFILVFQSVPAVILCLLSLSCFRMAAMTEGKYNIRKFGEEYKEYMKKVPMWNFFEKPSKH
jgi:protein-S-isoprenylcysteine O-methyltransferase Ste14